MLNSLYSGVSGLQAFQGQMDVIGNNIANVNTTAFKSARVEFADAFSQTLRTSAAGGGTANTTAAMQVGTGVMTSSIQNQFNQGSIARTGLGTDLSISGQGFFEVRDPNTNETFLTRAGDFHVDGGYLVTTNGYRVQGFSDAGLGTRGDILIDGTGAPATTLPGSTVASFSFNRQGILNVHMSDGTDFIRGQVLLQNVTNSEALVKEGDNLYSGMGTAGALANTDVPGTLGLGYIEPGALELSNVDLANEFSTLITTQRAFQACSRIITTSDEMLQELVNLKR